VIQPCQQRNQTNLLDIIRFACGVPNLPLPPLPALPQATIGMANEGDTHTSDLLLLPDAMMTVSEHCRVDNESRSSALLNLDLMCNNDDQSCAGDSLLLLDRQSDSDNAVLSSELWLNDDKSSSIVGNSELMPMEV
jgi:hypothetical protein